MTLARYLLPECFTVSHHRARALYTYFASLGLATPPDSLGIVVKYSIGLGAKDR